ncbi:coiled-coil domain-containing protein 122-like isoform X2 [Silurus meridionalis]|uniref:coiled-coil domain-containing protein 122-like isoform X2 n=1 Tax=Silurus meridionalis TaxID=175797 RepID=UPI001EE9DA43|nr:coiled-coil domain-containing protein 122-like isoform X2 [Silurus meridionalis]XP_046714498.1 coiled-coil domain-containing protein 122-like isoform X2 [Silurus meridionalis]
MSSEERLFSEQELCSALLEVSQQGEIQATELQEQQQILNSVQDTLSKIVKSYDTVSSNIKLKEQQIRCITNEIKQVQRQNERQQTEIQVIQMENMELKYRIEEQLERSHFYLTQYNTYHNKMESYKMSFSGMKSQAAIHKELKERREEVKRLKEHREELKVDLQNPEGNAMQRAQKQVDNFKAVIHNTKELVRRKGILLEKEKTNQSQLNKDIAIHNRRCEAIVKRLCCQLNKAHSSHGQLSSDIIHIEKELTNTYNQGMSVCKYKCLLCKLF